MNFRAGGYFLATIIQTITSFIAIGLLSRILGAEQFGRWALFEPVVMLGAQVALLGSSWGVLKLIAQDNLPLWPVVRGIMVNAKYTVAVTALVAMLSAWLLCDSNYWVLAIGFWISAESFLALLLSAYRGANQPTYFLRSAVVRASIILIGLILAWFSRVSIAFHAEQIALCWALASTCSVCVLLFGMSKKTMLNNTKQEIEISDVTNQLFFSAMKYGGPILIAAILASILSNADRYILASYLSPGDVGMYAITVKVASALNLLVTPLNLWWPTVRFKHLADEDGGTEFFSRAIVQLLTLFITAGCGLWLIFPMLISLMSPFAQPESSIVIALIISAVAMAMSVPFNVGALKEGKTHWNIVIVAISTGIQLVVGLLLAPNYGVSGVAWATCFGSLLLLFLTFAVSQRLHSIRWPIWQLLLTLIGVLGCAVLTTFSLDGIVTRVIFFVSVILFGIIFFRRSFWPIVN